MTSTAGHGHARRILLHQAVLLGSEEEEYADLDVMFDLSGVTRLNLSLTLEMAETDQSTTGITVTDGSGIYDPWNTPSGVIRADNTTVISDIVNPKPGDKLVKLTTTWNVDVDKHERLLFVTFANTDETNSALITLIADYD